MTSSIDIKWHLGFDSYRFTMINEYDKGFEVYLSSTNVRVIDVGYPAWGKRPTIVVSLG